MLLHGDATSKCQTSWFRSSLGSTPSQLLHALELQLYPRSSIRERQTELLWPLHCALRALSHSLRHGSDLKSGAQVSLTRQFKDCFRLLLHHNISPENYAAYRLFEVSDGDRLDAFFSRYQVFRIDRWLHINLSADELEDKLRFHELCRKHSIQTPDLLLSREMGVPLDCLQLPHRTFFVKDRFGRKGNAVQRWEYTETSGSWRRADDHHSSEDVKTQWTRTFGEKPFIIQELLRNHPELASLSKGALCTVRVVTFKLPNQPALVFDTVLRMPRNHWDADNLSQGGLVAGIDSNGTLMPARALAGGLSYRSHPETGEPIEGRTLPFLKQTHALATKSHEALSPYYWIGWDIALTENGPVLIEANRGWGANLVQLGGNRFMGETRYPELMSLAIRHRLQTHPEPRLSALAERLADAIRKTTPRETQRA